MHNEKSLSGTKSYYDYFIIKSNLLLAQKGAIGIENNKCLHTNFFGFSSTFPKL